MKGLEAPGPPTRCPSLPFLFFLFWLGDSVPLLKWTSRKKWVPTYSNFSNLEDLVMVVGNYMIAYFG